MIRMLAGRYRLPEALGRVLGMLWCAGRIRRGAVGWAR